MVSYREKILEARKRPDAPQIVYTDQDVPTWQIIAMYRAADCFVFPYRGEGFGMPMLEAMACGLPVIATAGGAADDFLDDDTAYRIPAKRRGIGRSVYE